MAFTPSSLRHPKNPGKLFETHSAFSITVFPLAFNAAIEQAIIDYLAGYEINAKRKAGAPGIYVEGAKIAALGLRVKNGCTYHGLSLNVDMDLMPFTNINPCGYEGMPVTQLKSLTGTDCPGLDQVILDLHCHLEQHLGYNSAA